MRDFALLEVDGNEIRFLPASHLARKPLRPPNGATQTSDSGSGATKKVHIFTGERVQVDKPKGAPAWMGDKIWKQRVKKVGIDKLEEV